MRTDRWWNSRDIHTTSDDKLMISLKATLTTTDNSPYTNNHKFVIFLNTKPAFEAQTSSSSNLATALQWPESVTPTIQIWSRISTRQPRIMFKGILKESLLPKEHWESEIFSSEIAVKVCFFKAGNPNWRRRLRTVDLVLTSYIRCL